MVDEIDRLGNQIPKKACLDTSAVERLAEDISSKVGIKSLNKCDSMCGICFKISIDETIKKQAVVTVRDPNTSDKNEMMVNVDVAVKNGKKLPRAFASIIGKLAS